MKIGGEERGAKTGPKDYHVVRSSTSNDDCIDRFELDGQSPARVIAGPVLVVGEEAFQWHERKKDKANVIEVQAAPRCHLQTGGNLSSPDRN
jgi:hypothetical protein